MIRNTIIEVSPDILCQEIDGETVILDLNSECYFGLDAVGTRIWQLIPQTTSFQQIVNALLEEYDIDEVKLEADVTELLLELSQSGLITLKQRPS